MIAENIMVAEDIENMVRNVSFSFISISFISISIILAISLSIFHLHKFWATRPQSSSL